MAERTAISFPRRTMAARWGERLLLALLAGLGTALFTFLALELARGTPFAEALGRASEALGEYLGRLLRGDLGTTQAGAWSSRRIPVAQAMAETLPRSLGLLGVTLGFSTLIGIVLGTLAAVSKRNLGASLLLFLSMLGASTPSFFLALLLQLFVLLLTRSAGRAILPVGGFGWGLHLVLPTLVLAARPVSQIARITFIRTREVLNEDFVRTARAKGVGRWDVLAGHVARNVAVPVLTTAAVSLRFALASLPVVEIYFAWPGAGRKLLQALSDGDANLAVGLLLALAFLFFLVQLLLEWVFPALDPRLADAPPDVRDVPRRLRDLLAYAVQRVRGASLHPFRWLRQSLGALVARSARGTARDRSEKRPRRSLRRLIASANPAFLFGAFVGVGLLAIVFFGAWLAPHSPYFMAGVEKADGVYRAPPFAPSERFPWGTDGLGRDLMSLVLIGAQQTLLMASVAVAARMVVGVSLGAIAGWRRGSILDRAIVGFAQVLAPFPALLLTILVIMAVGIQRGILPFAAGLCVVGWGEIAQLVRAEIIALRERPFVEGARAVGASTPRLIVVHLIPHLMPSLTALAALELSSVLMLLGELGFLGIFLGGGSAVEVNAFSPLAQYSNVPEWGALLATFRQSARAYPWVVFYPSLALFLSSFGFHLLGEGIRREIERGQLALRRAFRRLAVAGVAVGGLALLLLAGNLGPEALYRRDAARFDGQEALLVVAALTSSNLRGPETGSPGAAGAAEFIAREYKRLGLQPVGDGGSYFSSVRAVENVDDVPNRRVVGWVAGADSASKDRLARQVIVVMACYGALCDGDAASAGNAAGDVTGVAVLLEAARLLTQTEYQANRSFLFVAYGEAGWGEDGARSDPTASRLLDEISLPSHYFTLKAAVRLEAFAGDERARLCVETARGSELSEIFRSSAARLGVGASVSLLEGRTQDPGESGDDAVPEVTLSLGRCGERLTEGPVADSVSTIAVERAGRAVTLGLMVLGREKLDGSI
ncbi:MAG: ABC transporter permease subunit [Candidatus Bipolaricaulota bacterium]